MARQLPITDFAHNAAVIGDSGVAAGAVLTTLNMAAGRCRAGVLDGAHHLELAKAHMAAIGGTPCSPVAAEDKAAWHPLARHGSFTPAGADGLGPESDNVMESYTAGPKH